MKNIPRLNLRNSHSGWPAIGCLLFALALTISISNVHYANAANEPLKFGDFEVQLPGMDKSVDTAAQQQNPIITYISFIAKLIIAIIVACSLLIIVAAGFIWMTAAGNPSQVEKAKGLIFGALFGVFLALSAYLILNTISPQFVPTKDPSFGGDTTNQ